MQGAPGNTAGLDVHRRHDVQAGSDLQVRLGAPVVARHGRPDPVGQRGVGGQGAHGAYHGGVPGPSRTTPGGPSLFDAPGLSERSVDAAAPLAVRMRPRDLSELVGQADLVAPGSPLRRLIDGSGAASVILWGPPGTGKTTIASLVSGAAGRRFVELSAVTAGVKDVRAAIDTARMSGVPTVLFIDEVHRFTRTQQDALLPGVENGWVTLVAATTENPSFSVVSPLLSRSLLLTLSSLTDEQVGELLDRAVRRSPGTGRSGRAVGGGAV